MRHISSILCLLILCSIAGLGSGCVLAHKKRHLVSIGEYKTPEYNYKRIKKIAIFVDASNPKYKTLAKVVEKDLSALLTADPTFGVVERERLDILLVEKGLWTTGEVGLETVLRAGKLEGADGLIRGDLYGSGWYPFISLDLWDTSTGEKLRSINYTEPIPSPAADLRRDGNAYYRNGPPASPQTYYVVNEHPDVSLRFFLELVPHREYHSELISTDDIRSLDLSCDRELTHCERRD